MNINRLRFISFIAVAFINAFVDLGHKVVIQNTLFHTTSGSEQVVLTNILNAMILLPFIILFAPSAWLSDRFAKAKVMRRTALLAVGITSGITLCYYFGQFWLAYALTFVLAAQSAIYSPAKYGTIRELVSTEKLSSANGWVQGATTISILLSTLVFSFLFELFKPENALTATEVLPSLTPLGFVLVLGSLLEYYLACKLPEIKPAKPQAMHLDNLEATSNTSQSLHLVWNNQTLWLSIIGLALFWALCQVILVIFPAHAEEHLGYINTFYIQAMMAASAIGIAIGAIIAGQSRRHIETGFIPIGAALIATCALILPMVHSSIAISAVFFFLGFGGGLYLVPLNALLQFNAPEGTIGRVIASSNLVQNIVMILFLTASAVLSMLAMSATTQLKVLFLVAVFGALYTVYKLPQSLLRLAITSIIGLRYKINASGLDNLPREGGVLLLGNHMSFIDWALIQIVCPRPIRFVMHKRYYDKPLLNPIVRYFNAIPINPNQSKSSITQIRQALKNGEVVCLFPEGAISATGQLLTFKKGFELVVKTTDAAIVPFYLNGLWGSSFSRTERLKKHGLSRRNIYVEFGTEMKANQSAAEVKQAILQTAATSWQHRAKTHDNLGNELLRSLKNNASEIVVIDSISGPLTAARTAAGALRFAKWLKANDQHAAIGIMLPPGAGSTLLTLAAWFCGKTVVHLNYSANAETVVAAARAANLECLYTAPLFLERLQKKGFDSEALQSKITCVDVSQLRNEFSKLSLLLSLVQSKILPTRWITASLHNRACAEDCAALLFSSGSEGVPKGIELSHSAIASNCEQIIAVLQPVPNERILGALPHFHAFGLTATLVMPIMEGFPIVAHPDPTDAMGLAKAVEQHDITLMVLTGTIYHLLSRNSKITGNMLKSVRLCIAGAEKLHTSVRQAFEQKFNKPMLEGYGATEMAPVVSVNLPDRTVSGTQHRIVGNRPGTVGLPIPGTVIRIVDPNTLEKLEPNCDGLVLLAGPQQMTGYWNNPEKTNEVFVEIDGLRWYKTGDKGRLDEDGYLTIVDRYSRFAKIAGEMISLSAVEQQVRDVIANNELNIAMVAINDSLKGEKMICLSDDEINAFELRKVWKEKGYAALQWPAEFYTIDAIPMLGSGKLDFQKAKNIAYELSTMKSATKNVMKSATG